MVLNVLRRRVVAANESRAPWAAISGNGTVRHGAATLRERRRIVRVLVLIARMETITVGHATAMCLCVENILIHVSGPNTIRLRQFFPMVNSMVFQISHPAGSNSPFRVSVCVTTRGRIATVVRTNQRVCGSATITTYVIGNDLGNGYA